MSLWLPQASPCLRTHFSSSSVSAGSWWNTADASFCPTTLGGSAISSVKVIASSHARSSEGPGRDRSGQGSDLLHHSFDARSPRRGEHAVSLRRKIRDGGHRAAVV